MLPLYRRYWRTFIALWAVPLVALILIAVFAGPDPGLSEHAFHYIVFGLFAYFFAAAVQPSALVMRREISQRECRLLSAPTLAVAAVCYLVYVFWRLLS
jgi:hypothetical protein